MKNLRGFLIVALVLGLNINCLLAQEMPIYEWAYDYRRSSGHGIFSDYHSTTDANGNVYISGVMNAVLDADPGPGVFNLTQVNSNYDDVFIIKLNASGVFQWAHKYDRLGAQNGPADIVVDAAGNVFFASYYQLGFATNDTRLVKYDAAGNELWQKIIATKGRGGRQLTLDQSGNILMCGGFRGTVDFDPNSGVQELTAVPTAGTFNEMFLLKLTTDGNYVWAKSTGGPGNKTATSMTTDASGNILITGSYSDGVADFNPGAGIENLTPAGFDVFVLKLEDDGDFIWVRSMGGSDTDTAESIATSTSGNIFVTGSFRGSSDYDPTAGVTTLSTTSGTDIFLVRLNPDGSFGWASQFGNAGNYPDEGKSVAIDGSGNVLLTGSFMNTVDFDPGPGVNNLVSTGTFLRGNAFILKLTQDQTLIWARAFGSSSSTADSMGTSIDVDDAGMITVVGHTNGSFKANFGPCNRDLGGSTTHAFIVKLSVGFEAQPTLTSVSPASGTAGTPVVITGTNFGTDPADLEVRFGNNRLATITALTTTSITTTVPPASGTAQIYVKLKCFSGVWTTQTFVVGTPPTPTITNFTPAIGNPGISVTITGTNFSTTPANNTVMFNGTAAVVTASTATSITTTVPPGATTGKITVTISGVTATSASNFTVPVVTVNPPEISETDLLTQPDGTIVLDLKQLITTNGTLDLASIVVTGLPASGANATIINGVLTIVYSGTGFSGTETITIRACNTNGGCSEQVFEIQVVGDVTVYNAVSPNGDGKNEILFLEFVDALPDTRTNQVFIFNRWGDEVFSTSDYDNKTRAFSGINNDGNKLPSGVYYYKIVLPDKGETLTGYLELRF